jgi:hypothetical protein
MYSTEAMLHNVSCSSVDEVIDATYILSCIECDISEVFRIENALRV